MANPKVDAVYHKLKQGIIRLILRPLMMSPIGKPIRAAVPWLRAYCRIFPRSIVILSDGNVTTCCYDTYGANVIGSVYKNDLEYIWNNQIKNILSGDLYDLKRCRDCIGLWEYSRAPVISRKLSYYFDWRKLINKYPEVIAIEVTTKCNYNCCEANEMYKYRSSTTADLDKIFNGIKYFLPKIGSLFLSNVGEPLLHEGLCDFIRKCRGESKKLNIAFSTNGLLMTKKISECLVEQKVDSIIVSIHGGPGTENMLKYSKCGANYETVLKNTEQLVAIRNLNKSKVPRIEVKTVLFNWNDTDELMNRLREDIKKTGADRLYWVLDWEKGGLERSSKRFTPGSRDLEELIKRNEFESYS